VHVHAFDEFSGVADIMGQLLLQHKFGAEYKNYYKRIERNREVAFYYYLAVRRLLIPLNKAFPYCDRND